MSESDDGGSCFLTAIVILWVPASIIVALVLEAGAALGIGAGIDGEHFFEHLFKGVVIFYGVLVLGVIVAFLGRDQ